MGCGGFFFSILLFLTFISLFISIPFLGIVSFILLILIGIGVWLEMNLSNTNNDKKGG